VKPYGKNNEERAVRPACTVVDPFMVRLSPSPLSSNEEPLLRQSGSARRHAWISHIPRGENSVRTHRHTQTHVRPGIGRESSDDYYSFVITTYCRAGLRARAWCRLRGEGPSGCHVPLHELATAVATATVAQPAAAVSAAARRRRRSPPTWSYFWRSPVSDVDRERWEKVHTTWVVQGARVHS